MTYLNLLPERLRSRLQRRSGVRLLLLALLLALIITFDALVLRSFGVSLEQYVSVAETGMYEPAPDARQAKRRVDVQAADAALSSFRSVADVLRDLAAAAPDGVRIEKLSLGAAEDRLTVIGVGGSVEAADRFRRALSATSRFRKVSMPIRDLLNDGTVRFSLEADVELTRL